MNFQFHLLLHLLFNNCYETLEHQMANCAECWSSFKSHSHTLKAIAAHCIPLWSFSGLQSPLSVCSKSRSCSQWDLPALKLFWIALKWENVSFTASSPSLLFVSPLAVECRDTTRYCEKVKQLKLCQLTQFKSRCCGTCGKAWRRMRWKWRNKGISAFASLRQRLLQKIETEWNSFFFFFFLHFIYLFPFKKEKREEKMEKENPLPNCCYKGTWKIFPFRYLGDRMQQNMVMEGRSQRFNESQATGPERSGVAP